MLWINIFTVYTVISTLLLLLGLVKAWRHQDAFYTACRVEDAWKQHFKENVRSNWIHYDGVGS